MNETLLSVCCCCSYLVNKFPIQNSELSPAAFLEVNIWEGHRKYHTNQQMPFSLMMRTSIFSIGQLWNNTALVLRLNVITLLNELSKQTAKSLSKNWDFWITSKLVLAVRDVKENIKTSHCIKALDNRWCPYLAGALRTTWLKRLFYYILFYLTVELLNPSDIDFHAIRHNLTYTDTVTVWSFIVFRNCSFSAFSQNSCAIKHFKN